MKCGFFPLTGGGARMALLQAICALAEHGQLNEESSAARIVRAVLRNTRSFSLLGGVAGLPRSLNSVYAAAVALYLNAGFRGRLHRALAKPKRLVHRADLALTRDGCTLIVSDSAGDALHLINARDGVLIRTISASRAGSGPLSFWSPRQVWVASDDYVFVAEFTNKRVQVLTPRFEFHGFIPTKCHPFGVCANQHIVAVSELGTHRIGVYGRHDGALRYRFGLKGSGEGQLNCPTGLCFLADGRHIACADYGNDRISVFSVKGEFVKHVSCIGLAEPCSLACSASDELIVAAKDREVVVFNAAGEKQKAIQIADVWTIALHDCTIYSYSSNGSFVQVFR